MLKKECIYRVNNLETSADAISFLVKKLVNRGIVTNQYENAILEREADYPTGIKTDSINIAIPHADYSQVNESVLAVLVSETPIEFNRMEEPEETIGVNIVILMAIDSPHGHLEVLAKLGDLFSKKDVLTSIYEQKDTNEIYSILQKEVFK